MLSEDLLIWDYLTYAGLGLGALVIVYALVSRRFALVLIGLALPGGMYLLSVSNKIPLTFAVVIAEQSEGGMTWRKVKKFVGGEYTFRDGKRLRIEKPAGGPIGTVVINESKRALKIIRVAYSSTPNQPGPGGREVVAVVQPGGAGSTLDRVEHFGPEADGPPASMMSHSSFDTLDWLAW